LAFPEKCRRGHAVAPNEDRTHFITALLQRDVSKRLGSGNGGLGFETEIKTHPFLAAVDWLKVAEKKLEPTFKPNASFKLIIV
jgi:hypothetical protein